MRSTTFSRRTSTVTSGFPERGKVPLTFPTDEEAVALAFRLMGGTPPAESRVVRIWDTLHLSVLQVSEALVRGTSGREDLELLSAPEELRFLPDGSLPPLDWEAWMRTGHQGRV